MSTTIDRRIAAISQLQGINLMPTLLVRRSAVIAILSLSLGSAAFSAPPVVTQVWNNAQVFDGSVSSAVTVGSTDPTFTVFFKTTGVASADYDVRLQTSPDGTNWSTISVGSSSCNCIHVARSPANITYQMTIPAVKAAKVRLQIDPSVTTSGMASAWIVN